MFCTLWLRNGLRATTACTFSTSQLPKAVRSWSVLYILTWKCAWGHNGVQLFISHLASWLRTRRFSEPTFRPSGATNHWKKHGISRLSYLFAHLHLLSSDSFSSLIFFLSSNLSLLSASALLCFSSVHIVGSLTSKLPSINVSFCLSIYLQVWKRSYSWTWQHQKLCNSARLPQFLNLTTSKTQQFCETSSIFQVDHIKNEAMLRDFLNVRSWQHGKTKQFCETSFKNGKLSAELTASYQCVLRFFHSTCLKYCACHEKVMPDHTKCCTCPIIFPKLKIWCSKMHPFSGNQRPDLLTALMNMSLVLRVSRKMHLCRSSSNVPRLPSFLEMLQNPHVLFTFDKVHNPLRLPRKTTSERQKVVRTCGAFNILTSKCASRHNGFHFFDIQTSKSDPELRCFVHFDLEMCFTPQRRALFRHLNF